MTHSIIRDPAVATPVTAVPDAADLPGQATEAYEAGGVVVTAGGLLSADDLGVVRALRETTSTDNLVKKPLVPALLRPIDRSHVLYRFCPGDAAAAARLQEIVARGTEAARRLVAAAFPGYRVLRENITWRLTTTTPEPLHFDSYDRENNDLHAVRLFYNLDEKPRLWGVGPRVWEYLAARPDVAAAGRDKHPNRVTALINKQADFVAGPRHLVTFAPGALWFVNSQAVAHEIVFGRRLLAATFFVDPATAANPGRVFAAAVRSALGGTT